MKNLLIVFALIVSFSVNEAFAENKPQKVGKKIVVNYNGQDYVQVWLKQENTQKYRVKIYDLNFKLLYTESLDGKPGQRFNVSKFSEGFYLVLIERGNQAIYTEVIEKVKDTAFAKY